MHIISSFSFLFEGGGSGAHDVFAYNGADPKWNVYGHNIPKMTSKTKRKSKYEEEKKSSRRFEVLSFQS